MIGSGEWIMSELTKNAQEKSESRELSVQELEAVTGGSFLSTVAGVYQRSQSQLQPQGTAGAILTILG
jgi:hypothetical protein